MVSEEKAKELIIQNVYKCTDSLGYGKKCDSVGYVSYIVGRKTMTLSEYQAYCIKKELNKFGIKQ